MVNNQSNSKLTIPVDFILEVRICAEMWDRIRWVAERRECSYSWVVRYAVFRLIKRVDPKKYFAYIGHPRFEFSLDPRINQRAWERRVGASRRGDGAKHRHQLCLYGEDELAIRYAAAYYGCTMTHLIRVALELHFERLYSSMLKSSGGRLFSGPAKMGFFQRAFWFWLGIKVYSDVEFRNIALEKRIIQFHRYSRLEYYGKRFHNIRTDIGGNRKYGAR